MITIKHAQEEGRAAHARGATNDEIRQALVQAAGGNCGGPRSLAGVPDKDLLAVVIAFYGLKR